MDTPSASTPTVDDLGEVIDALRAWQVDAPTVPLHPGDLGWFWRFGAEATAAAVRTWRPDGRLAAVGLLDGPSLLRVAVAPDAVDDRGLARTMADDVARIGDGVLPPDGCVEARGFRALRDVLLERGWVEDETWSPLRRDLSAPVPAGGLTVEVAGPSSASARAAVQRTAFATSTFTDDRWRAMAAGPAYRDARCLLGFDDAGTAVAAATVWSAGRGRPGLLEPVGVHRDHRGRGFGRAISLAAAAALAEMGASAALVCTPSANTAAVATYVAAGFTRLDEVRDLRRSTSS